MREEVEKTKENEVNEWKNNVNRDIPKLLVTPVLMKGDVGWKVELPGDLQTIVWESGQLVQGGFQPPPLALHFSLHYPTIQTAAMRLQTTLKEYNEVVRSLSPIQVRFSNINQT